jgi:hypothetical protein
MWPNLVLNAEHMPMVPARYEHDDILTEKRQELSVIKTAVFWVCWWRSSRSCGGATSDGVSR